MSIQKANAGYRVSSGVVQFDDDWPGYFIRGDEAIGFAHDLINMAQALQSIATGLEARAEDLLTVKKP